ncbi:MAG: filamentous hemagglutinin N-terminal domain-containing protein [Hyphomicrobiaceae bacterium]|nr:filamentous hemagglutinin N-terminal domain-containing protein [Hyphomicrobiaceae bacterium]
MSSGNVAKAWRCAGQPSWRGLAAAALLAAVVTSGLRGDALAQQALPNGANVAAGSVSIGSSGSNGLVINQASQRAIVDWNSFSIGAGNSVSFVQPGSSAAILNRVTGTTGSEIAGQITGTGQVYLVNPNGIAITPTGTVSVGGGFIASTLGISNEDFLSGNLSFSCGAPGDVFNQGLITVGGGGFIGLIGGRVANEGRIAAPLGRIGLGAGEHVTLDLTGDGFLQILAPSQARDVDGRALIEAGGEISADGGVVVLRGATVRQSIRDVVNVPGSISAQSASGRNGRIILGGSGGGVRIDGQVQGSNVEIRAERVAIGGSITSRHGNSGGVVSISALAGVTIAPGAIIDASGSDGGLIAILSDGETLIGGRVSASGDVRGGMIDVSGRDVRLASAHIDARGGEQGGLARIGGAFRGGAAQDPGSDLFAAFIGRYGVPADLASAETVTIDIASVVDVSALRSDGAAGAVVVWSERETTVAGRIAARDAIGAGAIEISARERIASIALENIALGAGATLLLDPMNIIVQSGGDPAGSVPYDGAATDSFIDLLALSDLIVRDGISVVLEASNDILINGSLGSSTGGFAATYGDLTLHAGRRIAIYGDLNLRATSGGSSALTLVANDPNAVGPRDAGDAAIAVYGNIDVGSTGDVSITMGAGLPGQGGGGINLGEITAGSVTITQAGTAADAFTTLTGDITAAGPISLTGALVINPLSFTGHLEIISTSSQVVWLDEATHAIAAGEFPATVAFRETGELTRYGRLIPWESVGSVDNADATRLAVGPDSTVAVSRVYGDDNSTLSGLAGNPMWHVVRGSLQGGDTMADVIAPDALEFNGPEITANAGVAHGTTTPVGGSFSFATATPGYFIDFTTRTPVTITPRELGYAITSQSYEYGAPTPVVTLTGIVNGDSLAPVIDVPGLGTSPILVAGAAAGTFQLVDRFPAGTHAFTLIAVFGEDAGNYTLAAAGERDGIVSIAPRTVTYVCCDATSTYGSTPPGLSVVLAGILPGDSVTPSGTQISDSSGTPVALNERTDAGTYAISATGLEGPGSGNYRLATDGVTNPQLVIDPLSIGWALSSVPLVYGDAAPVVTVDGVLAGDDVGAEWRNVETGELYSDRLDAGTYSFDIGLVGADAGNYELVGQGTATRSTINLSQRILVADFSNVSVVYGMGGATPEPLLDGLLVGDDVTAVAAGFYGTTEAQVAIPVTTPAGTYGGTVIGLVGADAGNYRILSILGQVTITPRLVTATVAGGTYLYGDEVLGGSAVGNLSLANIMPWDAELIEPIVMLTDADGVSIAASTRAPAGVYIANVTGLAGPSASVLGNYVLDSAGSSGGTVRIDPRPITFTIGQPTITYGDGVAIGVAPWDFEIAPDGFVNGEGAGIAIAVTNAMGAAVPGAMPQAQGGTVVTPGTDAGTYTLLPTGFVGGVNGFDPRNYVLTGLPGTLTINPRSITYVIPDQTFEYGTTAPNASVIGILPGDDIVATPTDALGRTFDSRIDARAYAMWGVILSGADAGNYNLAQTGNTNGTLTVTPRLIDVSIGNLEISYGTVPSFNVTLSNVLVGDEVGVTAFAGINVARFPGRDFALGVAALLNGYDDVGRFEITATGLGGADAHNYEIAVSNPSQLLILPRLITVQLPDRNVEWGEDPFNGQRDIYVETMPGFGVGITLTTDARPGSDVGTYEIDGVASGSAAGNYVLSTLPGTLTIRQAHLRASLNGWSSVYGQFADLLEEDIRNHLQITNADGETSSALAEIARTADFGVVTASGITPLTGRMDAQLHQLGFTPSPNYVIDYFMLLITPREISLPRVITDYGTVPEGLSLEAFGFLEGDDVNIDIASFVYRYIDEMGVERTRDYSTQAFANILQRELSGGGYVPHEIPSVGTYDITSAQLVGADSGNYTYSGSGGTLVITPRVITLTGGSLTSIYGTELLSSSNGLLASGDLLAGELTFDNLVVPSHGALLTLIMSDQIVATGSGEVANFSDLPNVGSYTWSPSDTLLASIEPATGIERICMDTACLGANYRLASSGNADVQLTIAPRPVTYSVADIRATYGDAVNQMVTLNNVLERDLDRIGVAFGIHQRNADGSRGDLLALSGGVHTDGLVYEGEIARAPAGNYITTLAGLTGESAANYVAVSSLALPGTITTTLTSHDGEFTVDRRILTYTTQGGFGIEGLGVGPQLLDLGRYDLDGLIDGDVVIPELSLYVPGRYEPGSAGRLTFIPPIIIGLSGAEFTGPDAVPSGDYSVIVTSLGGPHGNNYQVEAYDAPGNNAGIVNIRSLSDFTDRLTLVDGFELNPPAPPTQTPAEPPASNAPVPAGTGAGTVATSGSSSSTDGASASAEAEASVGAGAAVSYGNLSAEAQAELRADAAAQINMWSTTPIDLSASVSVSVEAEVGVNGFCGGTPCDLTVGISVSGQVSVGARLDLLTGASADAETSLEAGVLTTFTSACGSATCVVSGGVTASVSAGAAGEVSWDNGVGADTEVGVSVGVDVTGEVAVSGAAGAASASGGISTGRVGAGASGGASYSGGALHLDLGMSLHLGIVGLEFDLGVDLNVESYLHAVGGAFSDFGNLLEAGLTGSTTVHYQFVDPAYAATHLSALEKVRDDVAANQQRQSQLLTDIVAGRVGYEEAMYMLQNLKSAELKLLGYAEQNHIEINVVDGEVQIIDLKPPKIHTFVVEKDGLLDMF